MSLILQEIRAGLLCVRDGGHFVLKCFTVEEETTVRCVQLLAACFSEAHIVKPITSRPHSDERYLVCLHYCGPADRERLVAATASWSLTECAWPPVDLLPRCPRRDAAVRHRIDTSNRRLRLYQVLRTSSSHPLR